MGLIEEHLAEHPHQVERREGIGEQHNGHQPGVIGPKPINQQTKTPKAAQGQHAGEASSRNQVAAGGGWHARAKASELGDVLAVGGGNHAAHTHEDQRLGQAMGKQQQHRNDRLLHCDGHEHQPQIGGGAIGERPLDIDLGNRHQRATNGADGANDQQNIDGHGRELQQRHHLQEHQGTTGDHR